MRTILEPESFLVPDWSAPAGVRALVTTRCGGGSKPPYAGFNLAMHVGDDPAAVAANRALLRQHLPVEPCWLEQVHGIDVVKVEVEASERDGGGHAAPPCADASVARTAGAVCAVMTADCLPVLFCDDEGGVVAAAHAGWRGLVAGVLEATLSTMAVPPERVMAWLGPAIGPSVFEVGDEVRAAFLASDPGAQAAFVAREAKGKWLADIFMLARRRLARAGVGRVFGGGLCTVSESGRFYSYRRDGATGRFVSLVWFEA